MIYFVLEHEHFVLEHELDCARAQHFVLEHKLDRARAQIFCARAEKQSFDPFGTPYVLGLDLPPNILQAVEVARGI